MEKVVAGTEAQKYVWEGAIPLQISLHDSEVTILPSPPPALILAPRIGFLPLLAPHIKPFFSSALPPGVDTVWFDYKGLPLKWFIPTGVLFDLLCLEPERPWNLTVHFRGYPSNMLIPCEGEDSIKWSFINSLKEAAYIINGNCKNVMNMSQSDQTELWNSVLNGNLVAYLRISSKLKLVTVGDEYTLILNSLSLKSSQGSREIDTAGTVKTGKIPVRLYVWSMSTDIDELESAPQIDSWDKISYINRPVEVRGGECTCFTLCDAVKMLLPEFFVDKVSSVNVGNDEGVPVKDAGNSTETVKNLHDHAGSSCHAEIKLIRIQGIEPKLEIPFLWVASNLMNPEHYLHICVCLKVQTDV